MSCDAQLPQSAPSSLTTAPPGCHSWNSEAGQKVLKHATVVFGPVRRAVEAGKFAMRMYSLDANFGKGGCGGYWLVINALDGCVTRACAALLLANTNPLLGPYPIGAARPGPWSFIGRKSLKATAHGAWRLKPCSKRARPWL